MHVLDIATILYKAVIHHKHIALAPRHLAHGTRKAQTDHRREPATHTEGDIRTDGLTVAQLGVKQEIHTVRELEEPRLLPTQQQRVGGEQIPDGTVPDILQALSGREIIMDIVDVVHVETVEDIGLSPVTMLGKIGAGTTDTDVRLHGDIALRTREELQLGTDMCFKTGGMLILRPIVADQLCLLVVA